MKNVFFLALASCIIVVTSCGNDKSDFIEPIPEEQVGGMLESFRDSSVVMYEKLAEGENKGNLWSEFKLSDLRDLLSQYADDDKVRLVTAADADMRPTILFQVVTGPEDNMTSKFFSPASSGVCPEPIGCTGEVFPENKEEKKSSN